VLAILEYLKQKKGQLPHPKQAFAMASSVIASANVAIKNAMPKSS